MTSPFPRLKPILAVPLAWAVLSALFALRDWNAGFLALFKRFRRRHPSGRRPRSDGRAELVRSCRAPLQHTVRCRNPLVAADRSAAFLADLGFRPVGAGQWGERITPVRLAHALAIAGAVAGCGADPALVRIGSRHRRAGTGGSRIAGVQRVRARTHRSSQCPGGADPLARHRDPWRPQEQWRRLACRYRRRDIDRHRRRNPADHRRPPSLPSDSTG